MKLKMMKTPMKKIWSCSSKSKIDRCRNKKISTLKRMIMENPEGCQIPQRKMRRRKVKVEVHATIVAKKVTLGWSVLKS